MTTPWYVSYQESNNSALSGASGSPGGAGMFFTIDSRISWMPIPALALAVMAPEASSPIEFFDLVLRLFDVRARQIDLVDHRDDLKVVIDRKVRVGQRLRFHPL